MVHLNFLLASITVKAHEFSGHQTLMVFLELSEVWWFYYPRCDIWQLLEQNTWSQQVCLNSGSASSEGRLHHSKATKAVQNPRLPQTCPPPPCIWGAATPRAEFPTQKHSVNINAVCAVLFTRFVLGFKWRAGACELWKLSPVFAHAQCHRMLAGCESWMLSG